ncbi:MAG: rod-binding protein [Halocynthiibacter sp.]
MGKIAQIRKKFMDLPHLNSVAAPAKPTAPASDTTHEQLWTSSQALEVEFLSEMLKAASFGKPREQFGGGQGEEQFGSFLRKAHAKAVVDHGGIGLAQQIFNSLVESPHDKK